MNEPNYQPIVAQLAGEYPAEWQDAHRPELGVERSTAFIRRVAWACHQVDPRVGLNGKRGTDELSMDALSVDLRADPAYRRLVVVDCIIGAGGPNPQPAWQWDVGGASKWIPPAAPDGETTPAPDPPPDTGDLEARVARLEAWARSFGR